MPEGDTIHYAARRIRPLVEGLVPVVQFDGPVLELLTESRTRVDRRLAQLGPDIPALALDEPRFLRLLREDDPTRPIGEALLDWCPECQA